MPGYIIARVKVTDTDKYWGYLKVTPAIVAKYGGKFIIRGGEKVTLEGAPIEDRIVVIEFPNLEKAKAWYNSKEYQDARNLREGAAEASFCAVDGV